MATRRILVVSTQSGTPRSYNADEATWGELKSRISNDFGDIGGMAATIKEGKIDLLRENQSLPTTDFTLYLTPSKIKAGKNAGANK